MDLDALQDTLPAIVIAGGLIALLSLLRVRYRAHEFASACGLPARLFFFYVVLAVLAPQLPSPDARHAVHVGSQFVFALAATLTGAIAVFDLFLTKYRGVHVAKILRDTIVLAVFSISCFWLLDTDLTSIIATSAVLTAVIGFALQDLLSNIIAGLALQAEQPFKRGDWVGFGDQEGVVLELNWRSTKIKTLHNDIVVIPNNVITKASVINFTSPSVVHRRRFKVGLRYEVPPNRAKASILAATESVEDVLERPKPYVQLLSFDDFSITYRVNFYINNFRRRESIEDEVRTRLWYQLERDGLSIPFPIRDVNLQTITPETRAEDERRDVELRLEYLRGVPLLEPLSDEESRLLATRSKWEHYAAGEEVIVEGHGGDSMYIIVSGEVDVCLGDERRVVASLSPGSYFGEMSLMTGEQRSATVVVRSDGRFIVIDKQAFQALLLANDRLIADIGEKLAARLESLQETQREMQASGAGPDGADAPTSFAARIRSFFHGRS